MAKHAAYGRSNIFGIEQRSRHLIKQGLKGVVVVPVNQGSQQRGRALIPRPLPNHQTRADKNDVQVATHDFSSPPAT